jgi:glycosyltransferase involved in cell wall biosynthesis
MKRIKIWGSLDPFFEAGAALGRRQANAQFMEFLLREDPFDRYDFFLKNTGGQPEMERRLNEIGPRPWRQGRIRLRNRLELPEAVAHEAYHCFHLSDCIVHPAPLAGLRNALSRAIFPITSVTHSLSYAHYHEAFLKYLSPTTTLRDCVAATSRTAVRALEAFYERLRRDYRLPEQNFPAPSIRRIPLGVDLSSLRPASPKEKARLRQGMGLSPEACCFLVFGRISHDSKMDIVPLLRALQRLINQGAPRDTLHLVAAGWADHDDSYPQQLTELAANLGLPFSLIERPSEAEKTTIYQAADVFVSIADNPQETFGLTILEAQAAGLPIVASDYDGYKDLVVHEQTGLLVETLGPHETERIDLLAPLIFDNQYHLLLAQQTAVSTPALAAALGRLIADPSLRRSLGAAGRRRVEEKFSWPAIIRQWVGLWDELQSAKVDPLALRSARHPMALPYADIFAGYPSRLLGPEVPLLATPTGQALRRGKDSVVLYALLEPFVRVEALDKLLFLARKPLTAGAIVDRLMEMIDAMTREQAWMTLRWAVKQDLLEPTGSPAGPLAPGSH